VGLKKEVSHSQHSPQHSEVEVLALGDVCRVAAVVCVCVCG
jgi:hypothetical protein